MPINLLICSIIGIMITALRQQFQTLGKIDIKNISLPRKEYCITALALLTLASLAAAWQARKVYSAYVTKKSHDNLLESIREPNLNLRKIYRIETHGVSDWAKEEYRNKPIPNTLFESQANVNLSLDRVRREDFLASIREPSLDLNKVEREEQSIPLWAQTNFILNSICLSKHSQNFVADLRLKSALDSFNLLFLELFISLKDEMLDSQELLEIKFYERESVNTNKDRVEKLFEIFYKKVQEITDQAICESFLQEVLNRDPESISLAMSETLLEELILLNAEFPEIMFDVIGEMHNKIEKNYGKNYSKLKDSFSEFYTNMGKRFKKPNFQKSLISSNLKKISKRFNSVLSSVLVKRYEVLQEKNKTLINEFQNSENYDPESKVHFSICNVTELSSTGKKTVEHWIGKIRHELTVQAHLFAELGMAKELDVLLKKEKTLFSMKNDIWALLKISYLRNDLLEVIYSNRKSQVLQAIVLIDPNNLGELEFARKIILKLDGKFWDDYYDYSEGDSRKAEQGINFTRLIEEKLNQLQREEGA
ncbi:MAG: hypothetical protein ChlgKO_03160 [Chlamydiales bacterium]